MPELEVKVPQIGDRIFVKDWYTGGILRSAVITAYYPDKERERYTIELDRANIAKTDGPFLKDLIVPEPTLWITIRTSQLQKEWEGEDIALGKTPRSNDGTASLTAMLEYLTLCYQIDSLKKTK